MTLVQGASYHEIVLGETISHYKIVEKLGSGGMGEVWKAQDLQLGRFVAIKFLPGEVSRDPQAVQRFFREARAAAALNHPNICSVHEFGEQADNPFLVMEYLEGETLRDRLESRPIPLPRALEWSRQIADALDCAHAHGVVHRDLKPANVFVTQHGVKVLDFGLAKITQVRKVSELTTMGAPDSGPDPDLTSPGTTMGTVAYMSPEQARGEALDARTDLFSLGTMMYEMVTGATPFPGPTSASIYGAILHKEAAPPSRANAEIPPELDRIVGKALEKDRELRYQSAAEMRADIKRLMRDSESGRQTTVVSVPVAAPASASASDRRKRAAIFAARIAAVLITLAVIARIYWRNSHHELVDALRWDNLNVSRLTNTGASLLAAISPDGRYVAHVHEQSGAWSLRLRQVATTSDVEIVPPDAGRFSGLTFSPDGNFIYYVRRDARDFVGYLFVVPTLGGAPRKLVDDVDSAVSFSPDSSRLAFLRFPNGSDTTSLLITAGAQGGDERTIATSHLPDKMWHSPPAWSPDGQTIAVAINHLGPRYGTEIFGFPVNGGPAKAIAGKWFFQATDLKWIPDGSGLLVDGSDIETLTTPQLWLVSRPSGDVRRLTNDLNEYLSFSISSDGEHIATVQRVTRATIWVSSGKDAGAPFPSAPSEENGGDGIAWLGNDRIVFSAEPGATAELWSAKPDGSDARSLTQGVPLAIYPAGSVDGKTAVYTSGEGGGIHVWRMDADGGNRRQLSNGDLDLRGFITPDGKSAVYFSLKGTEAGMFKLPLEGGAPAKMTAAHTENSILSPDGLLLAEVVPNLQRGTLEARIRSVNDGSLLHTLDVPTDELSFSPDSRSIEYEDSKAGVSNLWDQPLDGGPPRQITNYTSDHIFAFAWSPDGKHLALSRGSRTSDVILLSGKK